MSHEITWRVRCRLWRIFHLMMLQMFSIVERSVLQIGQFSTRTLLLWSHAVIIAAVCYFTLSCWNTHHLEGSICCSKTVIYLSAFLVPSKTCKLSIPYALMHLHTSEMLAFELNADNTLEGLPPLYPGGHGIRDFQQECQIWTCLAINTFPVNEPSPTEHDGASGPCSHICNVCRQEFNWLYNSPEGGQLKESVTR